MLAATAAVRAVLPLARLRRIERVVRALVKQRLPSAISVAAVGSGAMRALNRQRRGVNEATDVLSFGAVDAPVGRDEAEVILCVPKARQQAKQYGHSLADELTVLLVHGLLHIAGFDHHRQTDAVNMRHLEHRALQQLDVRHDGLITRAAAP